ncbi:hypothetical protein [Variovorax sp. W6]|uniref:hypothetical protein n=1 Tax=Variovorax sp. W6 TaxID=3093895 RepID=UPI003D801E67
MASALLLACATQAFATGSMQCEGRPYSAEIQFRLSTGEPMALLVARTDREEKSAPERFELRHKSVDHTRQVMSLKGTSLEAPARAAMLNISKTRGTLTYAGSRHRLRCDWDGAG